MKIVKSKVREELDGLRASSDFFDALENAITALINDAKKRAKENGRKTLRPYDV
ncbi:DUF1931 domain-containing protein [archaeon CG10_big_fil_rev_8_21_14_0_10_43_11]|nr:MAG: DUF1931 domain-containing protein [archaeon CG10_big_fil_rev_8_21_14_0_10_43_11]